MKLSHSRALFGKSEAALLAALELYNKPDFRYREESFSILMLNAWELLLKAKYLAENNNHLRSLYVYQTRLTKLKTEGQRRYVVKSRTGDPRTLGMHEVINGLFAKGVTIPPPALANLEALVEIRDNSIHYLNSSRGLSKRVQEVGTASVRNFVTLAQTWFLFDLGQYNLYLLPIGFVSMDSQAIVASPGEARLMDYISRLIAANATAATTDFHVAMDITVNLRRSTAPTVTSGAPLVAISNDPSAMKVQMTEEDLKKSFPWDYGELCKRLHARFADFRLDKKFYALRDTYLKDQSLIRDRFLDPGNLKSTHKRFYNPNILAKFDPHYTKKGGKV